MKKLFLSIIALATSTVGYAQVTEQLTATLQSGTATKVFYGNDGLKTAIAEAATNDIITLSSGVFNNPGAVDKAVKIYGSGFEDDAATGVKLTKIEGTLTLQNEANLVDGFGIEGVWVNGDINAGGTTALNNLKVVKCRFSSIVFRAESSQVILRQCYISGNVTQENTAKVTGLMIQNCYINGEIGRGFNTESGIMVDHCILTAGAAYYSDYYHGPWYYTNTVINRFITAGGVCYNCIGAQSFIERSGTYANCYYDYTNWATLFGDEQNNLNYLKGTEPRSFTIADTYMGNDGTVVGLHGGTYGWDKIPSTPRIISSTIDSKTSADGKLKVNIKAVARPVTE
jgi:hypothetical protein